MQKNVVNYKFPNGDIIELFYIGTLAQQLGRKSETIRKWEIQGVIPETIFKDKTGKRLYSAKQIAIIVEEAERAKLAQGKAVSDTKFVDRCAVRIKELNNEYLTAMKVGADNE